MKKIENIRFQYNLAVLNKEDLHPEPMGQFKLWFSDLLDTDIIEPTAMVLSTYSKDTGSTSRVVLLKDIDVDGFVFYTNYDSLKAQQISANKNTSLCFFWPNMQRQVRITGCAIKLSEEKSNIYFRSRPRQSQLAAVASTQSQIIKSRDDLEDRFRVLSQKYHNKTIPKPKKWGGYKVVLESIEFWQGRSNRMHDRFRYDKTEDQWSIVRLDP
jgi:pyridoxamine 5'-phosphate oxidase